MDESWALYVDDSVSKKTKSALSSKENRSIFIIKILRFPLVFLFQ